MISSISKHSRSSGAKYAFCVLIPSWNNLEYLKNCIGSLRKNSQLPIQVIVIVNEGIDGTVQWLESQPEIDFIYAEKNIGICYALNITRSLIKSDYIVYLNDDMYVLPQWDKALYDEIQQIGTTEFMLSGTMIEPVMTGNPCTVVKDYGKDLAHFDESLLLKEYPTLFKPDWSGSMWPPNVVHIDMWDLVGGMSIEFSPGLYSDPDLARKLFEAGVRIFKGKGNSLVYHFTSKTTHRLGKNKGRKIFISKWGLTPKTFTKHYLHLGVPYSGRLSTPRLNKKILLLNLIKKKLNA